MLIIFQSRLTDRVGTSCHTSAIVPQKHDQTTARVARAISQLKTRFFIATVPATWLRVWNGRRARLQRAFVPRRHRRGQLRSSKFTEQIALLVNIPTRRFSGVARTVARRFSRFKRVQIRARLRKRTFYIKVSLLPYFNGHFRLDLELNLRMHRLLPEHPNVVKYIGACTSPPQPASPCIVTEFIPGKRCVLVHPRTIEPY